MDGDWRMIRGKFLAINAASMSCACPRSPKGLSPAAHLADGTTDLILVRKCSRINFLRHLLRHTTKDDQVQPLSPGEGGRERGRERGGREREREGGRENKNGARRRHFLNLGSPQVTRAARTPRIIVSSGPLAGNTISQTALKEMRGEMSGPSAGGNDCSSQSREKNCGIKSLFDLNFVEVHRVRKFRFMPKHCESDLELDLREGGAGGGKKLLRKICRDHPACGCTPINSSWNCDGEVLPHAAIEVGYA
ncbi:hypothetical protein JZ751_024095 [Albula glossodonta]|uniref:Ceramide kinase C-terminal domain-containing protein n=1 Tax=Albula glossodonta TaxID=121402 RepID=A0A8T2NRU5_9TELE|nr:hypothetical protein JZ751_024095 [Albula glossodonta]